MSWGLSEQSEAIKWENNSLVPQIMILENENALFIIESFWDKDQIS